MKRFRIVWCGTVTQEHEFTDIEAAVFYGKQCARGGENARLLKVEEIGREAEPIQYRVTAIDKMADKARERIDSLLPEDWWFGGDGRK